MSLASGCAAVAVNRDYAPNVDFTAYRTYALRAGSTREGEPRSLIEQRAQAAINRALTAKGLRPVADPEAPDLLVISRFETRDRVEVVPYYSTYGGYWFPPNMGWGWGYGWSTTSYPYVEGTLVVDLVDTKSNNVVWTGRARRTTSEADLPADKIDEMVKKLLEEFPPEPKKS